jgi:hypothetical protein
MTLALRSHDCAPMSLPRRPHDNVCGRARSGPRLFACTHSLTLTARIRKAYRHCGKDVPGAIIGRTGLEQLGGLPGSIGGESRARWGTVERTRVVATNRGDAMCK